MSSNNQETMSHTHTLNGHTDMDVTNLDRPTPHAPVIPPDSQNECMGDPIVVSSRELVKSVKVSSGKRRKVIEDNTSTLPGGRRTRFGAGNSQIHKQIKSAIPKNVTPKQVKNATRSAHQKRLHETYELHDTKVRELFHLTKFVTLVDYDAKAAKEDESEVFKEVMPRYLDPEPIIVVQATI